MPEGTKTPKTAMGRPKGSKNKKSLEPSSEAERIELEATARKAIVTRQRDDCAKLAIAIKKARKSDKLSITDVSKLVRATEILHDLERDAHDFGNKGQAACAVIMIPVPAETMAQWDILSAQVIPRTKAPAGITPANRNVSYEDAVIGERPTEEPAPDPGEDKGPQAPGGESL